MVHAHQWPSLFLVSFVLHASPCFASSILSFLQVTPSEESRDYVANKRQFQLHELLTEQRHPNTKDLSFRIESDTLAGLEELLSVDGDITKKLHEISQRPECLEAAVRAVEHAILEKKKIYIYGCGATGRLAKQMESSFWRPFWKKMQAHSKWSCLKEHFPNIENALIGEMTGADRALISSLEGFEDLQLIGRLQLEEHGIQAGDAVFAITEGGETSSVIGTILAAPQGRLFFIYNNPDPVLLPFDRSRAVLENEAIAKICLCTGPQALAGSTRMQATTIQTFVMGVILEQAIHNLLRLHLSDQELTALGFVFSNMQERLLSFQSLQTAVYEARTAFSSFTDLETDTYRKQRFATYFAKDALLTVFTDATERSPTFKLFPLDTVQDPERKCWIQVWTPAGDQKEAWLNFLGRPFRGLNPGHYQEAFLSIEDPYLREAALNSLKNAGDAQQFLYDFSFAASNISSRGPRPGDLGVLILLADEVPQLMQASSSFRRWLQLFANKEANLALILVEPLSSTLAEFLRRHFPCVHLISLPISPDPMNLRPQIGLKMLLNAHSTGVMAKLGRVIGNTMTNVKPGNLKLIGRATYLIYSHVNDALEESERISYAEANAILFDAIAYTKSRPEKGQRSEVALSIVRILESLKRKRSLTWDEADKLLQERGLKPFLKQDS